MSGRLLADDFEDFDDSQDQKIKARLNNALVEELMEGVSARCFGLGSFDDVFMSSAATGKAVAQDPAQQRRAEVEKVLYGYAVVASSSASGPTASTRLSVDSMTIEDGTLFLASAGLMFRPERGARAFLFRPSSLSDCRLSVATSSVTARLEGTSLELHFALASLSDVDAARRIMNDFAAMGRPAAPPTFAAFQAPVTAPPTFAAFKAPLSATPPRAAPAPVTNENLAALANWPPSESWKEQRSSKGSPRQGPPPQRRFMAGLPAEGDELDRALEDPRNAAFLGRMQAAQSELQQKVAEALAQYHATRQEIMAEMAGKQPLVENQPLAEVKVNVAVSSAEVSTECGLCCAAEVDREFKPCGHQICSGCAGRLANGGSTCPWCRQQVSLLAVIETHSY